ncbi:hypothetical protein ES703_77503 [subsurface metagenome]
MGEKVLRDGQGNLLQGKTLAETQDHNPKNIKSGQSIGAKAAIVQVDFGTAFTILPRVILTPHSDNGVWLTEVTVDYFKWDNNSKSNDVTIDWIATAVGNP